MMQQQYTTDYVGNVPARIFVGLGGVGGRAVQRIYQRLHKNPTWRTYKADCTGFIVLDTNEGDLSDYTKEEGIKAVHIASHDSFDKLTQKLRDRDKHLASFMDPKYRPRKSQKGAGQIRIESRVKFYLQSTRVARTIESVLDQILDTNNVNLRSKSRSVDVFVFCSLAGGTGSGCFIPMAYLLREVIETKGFKPTVFGNLMTSEALEAKVKPEIHKFIHANTYAALKELEHLSRVGCEGVNPIPFVYRQPANPNSPIPTVKDAPFNWVVLVDEPSGRDFDNIQGNRLNDAMADTSYINLMTTAHDTVEGERDNYTRFMTNMSQLSAIETTLSEAAGDAVHTNPGYTKYYGTHGSAALVCPDESLLEYCAYRYVADTLKNQLGGAATDDSEGVDLDSFPDLSPKVREELSHKQWIRWVERQAKLEEDRVQSQLERLRKATGDDSLSAKASSGRWQALITAVRGKQDASTSSSTPVKLSFGKKPATAEKSIEDSSESLVIQLKQLLNAAVKAQSFRRLKGGQQGDGQMKTVVSIFGSKKAEAEDLQPTISKLKRRLETNTRNGERFKELRKNNKDIMSGTAERFLILELLTNKTVDSWITDTREVLKAKRAAGFLGEKRMARAAEDFAKYQEDAMATETSSWFQRTFGNPEATAAAARDSANTALNAMCNATNAAYEAELELAQLEALKVYIETRAKTFSEVAALAAAEAQKLEGMAGEVLSEGAKGEHNYAIQMEALRSLNGDQRLWREFWEDYARQQITHDPKWTVDTISAAFAAEEKRAEHNDTDVDRRRIVRGLVKQFSAKAKEQLRAYLQGTPDGDIGITLDGMLELEAVYATMPPLEKPTADTNAASQRRSKLTADLKVLTDPDDPDFPAVHSRIQTYIRRKMMALANKSVLLSKVNLTKVQDRPDMAPLISQVLIADRRVLDRLVGENGKYPEIRSALKSPDGDNSHIDIEDNNGFQAWDNPRVMMIYSVAGILPVFAFERLDDLHQYYASVAYMGKHKPNPLHTDHAWENTLADLDPVALEYEQSWNRLRDALGSGTVYFYQGRWRLRVGNNRMDICTDIAALHERFTTLVSENQMSALVDAEATQRGLDHKLRQKLVDRFTAVQQQEKMSGGAGTARASAAERLISELNELLC